MVYTCIYPCVCAGLGFGFQGRMFWIVYTYALYLARRCVYVYVNVCVFMCLICICQYAVHMRECAGVLMYLSFRVYIYVCVGVTVYICVCCVGHGGVNVMTVCMCVCHDSVYVCMPLYMSV